MKKHILTLIILAITTSWLKAQTIELWGMTSSGGQDTAGVIYKVTPTGTLTAEYSFKDYYSGDSDGLNPSGSLLEANDGLLYGMTYNSSPDNHGAIFRYNTTTGAEKVLDFFNAYNGGYPNGDFIQATNGLLYGTTSSEGAYDAGSVITYDISTGVTTDIYDFNDNNNDGNTPLGDLYQASDSLLYGLTSSGGTSGAGEIFSIDPANNNNYTVLYNFVYNDTDGVRPNGSLIQAKNGLLYGLAFTGGSNFASYGGTIFSYNITTHKEKTVWSFGGSDDGSTPYGSLLQVNGNDSLLFGLTNGGDSNTDGTIFSFNINTGQEQTLHIFALDGHEGFFPYGSLMQASDGKLYGTTSAGGASNEGAIFNYDIATGTETTIASFDGTNGNRPFGNLIELTSTAVNQLSVTNNQLSVYPNPGNGIVTITSSKNINEITVTNLVGQTELKSPLGDLGVTKQTLNLSSLPDGLYFVTATTNTGTVTEKFVVAK